MSLSLKRVKRARLLVALTAVVIPLLVPVAADAAMGGAQPAVSTGRPVLLSATVVTPNKVRYCFDKQVRETTVPGNSTLEPFDFLIGGYRANQEIESVSVSRNIDLPDLKCLDATYDSTSLSVQPTNPAGSGPRGLESFSYGRVRQDGVASQAGNQGSIGDSTALSGSSTHNGTTGLSAGPDLVGVARDLTANALLFVFDEKVKTADCSLFSYYQPNGTRIDGQLANANPTYCASSDNVVQVPFLSGPGTVSDATRVVVFAGAVTARTEPGSTPNQTQSAVIPGKDGRTARPDLVSAVISPDGSTILYTFDEPVAAGTSEGAGLFHMGLANGSYLTGTGTPVVQNFGSSGTVRVTFTDGNLVNEYAVIGSVGEDGIRGTSGLDNTAGGVPIGDNAGAFASGFTTGAEALRTTFNASSGEVDVLLDQRIARLACSTDGIEAIRIPVCNPNSGFHLLAADGSDLGVAPGSVGLPSNGTAQQVTLKLFFTPQNMQVARSLKIDPFTMFTNLSNSTDSANVEQATSPFTTAAVLRKGSRAVWHKMSRRANRAAVRRFRARALARSHSKKK